MANHRWWKISCLVEALAFAAFVGMYIWKWQTERPETWLGIFAWLFLSALVRKDTPKIAGWRADNFWPAKTRVFVFRSSLRGRLRRGIVFGHAASLAGAPDRSAAVCWLPGILRDAAGGAEFVSHQPLAHLF